MRHSFLSQWRLAAIATSMVAAVLSLSSCSDDDDSSPVPTVELASSTASNAPGNKISISATVNAPAGGKTLTFTVNGVADAAMPDVALKGDATETVVAEYTIPTSAGIGSTINIGVVAVDKKDQKSASSPVTVTVSATASKTIVEVSGNITADAHWTADKIYRIKGFVNVGTDTKDAPMTSTATLTIDAGTLIYGATGTPGGTLIIHRGSKIIANGTAVAPIVFTTNETTKKPGLWGGLVLCGQASNNNNAVIELEGSYGGWHSSTNPNDADNSGSLKYVRVEFAGYPINPNQEINGITFGSVGSGTVVDHVQVSYSADDSFEWFGGTVNATNLISYKAQDDDFDTDNGYTGKVQFGVAIRDAQLADQSGSNGFESDNDPTGTTNTPITAPVFSNMTIIGGKQAANTSISSQFQNGAHLRRSTKLSLINSIITGFPTGIFVDGTQGTAVTNANSGDLKLQGNILAGVSGWGGNNFGTQATADEQTALGVAVAGANHPNPPRGRIFAAGTIPSGTNPYINGVFTITDAQIDGQSALNWFRANDKNTVVATWDNAKLAINSNVFEPLNGAPTLLAAGTLSKTGANFQGFAGITGITTANITYIGAFGADTDWTTGWSNWNPVTTKY